MRAVGPVGLLLLVPALLAVLVGDVLWPLLRRAGRRVTHWPPLAWLHRRIGRLPVVIALPLFLIPEACSRLGWLVSVWLVLQGQPWRALLVYAGTKLIAGGIALWVCSACLPVLLRVRAFAVCHAAVMRAQCSATAWAKRRSGGRFGTVLAGLRARITARS